MQTTNFAANMLEGYKNINDLLKHLSEVFSEIKLGSERAGSWKRCDIFGLNVTETTKLLPETSGTALRQKSTHIKKSSESSL